MINDDPPFLFNSTMIHPTTGARRTHIIIFEGGDLRTVDPRPSRSNSGAPGTRGWAVPPKTILNHLIDRWLVYWMFVVLCVYSYAEFLHRVSHIFSTPHARTVGGGDLVVSCGRWPFPDAPQPPRSNSQMMLHTRSHIYTAYQEVRQRRAMTNNSSQTWSHSPRVTRSYGS